MAAPLRRGDQIASPPVLRRTGVSDDRQPLAKAISAVKATETDLIKLRDAQDRAHTQRLQQWSALADAETILTALRDREAARVRHAFVNGLEDASPLPQAEATVTQVRANLTKIENLEASIAAEITAVEQRLDRQWHQLDEEIGKVLVASPQLAALNAEIRDTWARLRTLRGAAAAINHAVPHAAPDRALSSWEAIEAINPGDPRDAVDHDLIDQWVAAVQALHDDASAPLPEV
jgi:hypothetical protein